MSDSVFQGEIELVRFDTTRMLADIQRSIFPKLTARVTCQYRHTPTLGFIRKFGDDRYAISLHSIFNHPDTPELVIRHVLIHELLHIEVPPRGLREGEVDPRISEKRTRRAKKDLGLISHPTEFWEREKEISPDRKLAMGWILEAFSDRLEMHSEEECIKVKKWRREYGCGIIRPTLEEARNGNYYNSSE